VNDINSSQTQIPRGLRTWFVIHFVADMLFGIPLLFFPEQIMPWFGWTNIDPIMSRLVGAALLGIGGESLLSRNAAREVFRPFLRLKIFWAVGAILGIALGISAGGPTQAWLFLLIFSIFLLVWIYYHFQLNKKDLHQ
jgi:hypothetical protein